MTDSGTDTFVGVMLAIVAVVAIASAAGTEPAAAPSVEVTPTRPTPAISPASGTRATTNIPTGTLFMCTGTVISTDSVALGSGSLTLQVYYSPINGG